MSKRKSVTVADSSKFKVAAKKPWLHSSPDENKDIDWEKCFLCQDDLTESLQSSIDARSVDPQQAYNDLAERIIQFQEINMLPMSINIEKLATDEELGASLFKNKAKFQKNCKLKFGKEKLSIAKLKHKKLNKENRDSHTSTTPGNLLLILPCLKSFFMQKL